MKFYLLDGKYCSSERKKWKLTVFSAVLLRWRIVTSQVPADADDEAAIAHIPLDTISALEARLDGAAKSLKQVLGKGSLRPCNEYSLPVSLPSCLGAATPVLGPQSHFLSDCSGLRHDLNKNCLVSDTTSPKTVWSVTRPYQKLSGPYKTLSKTVWSLHDLIKNCLVKTVTPGVLQVGTRRLERSRTVALLSSLPTKTK